MIVVMYVIIYYFCQLRHRQRTFLIETLRFQCTEKTLHRRIVPACLCATYFAPSLSQPISFDKPRFGKAHLGRNAAAAFGLSDGRMLGPTFAPPFYCLLCGLGPVDIQRNGGVFGQKSPSAALKMLARCSTLLRFLPCIRGFFVKKPLR